MAIKLVSKPAYLTKLYGGGLIPKFQGGNKVGHVWPIIDSWDPRRWGDPIYDGTFSQAYGAARKNGDKTFQWNGKAYNTDYKFTPVSNPVSDYNSLRYNYLESIENPTREGYDESTQRWTPPKRKGFDPNQIGIGLDMNKNSRVKNFLRQHGRTNNPWLSHQEMLNLQNDTLSELENILDRHTDGIKLSNIKRAIAIGLLYHGYGPYLWKPNGPRTQRLNETLFSGSDQDFINAVTDFYNGSYSERSRNHSNFWKGRQ